EQREHRHLERPGQDEPVDLHGSVLEAREEDPDEDVHRVAAEPRLDAEPAAGDDASKDRGDIRAPGTERSAHEDWERDAVLRADMRIQEQRDRHDRVAEDHDEDRGRGIEAEDESDVRQAPRRYDDAAADPEREERIQTPVA